MKMFTHEVPFFLFDVENHAQVKEQVISAIKTMGVFSIEANGQKMYSTDWHLPEHAARPYFPIIKPIFEMVRDKVVENMGYNAPLPLQNYWYQEYKKGDYHSWHIHERCTFSNVYYVSLPEGSVQTTFEMLGKEFTVEVKEGQLLSFPGVISHCSKPNQSEESKLVIAVNF